MDGIFNWWSGSKNQTFAKGDSDQKTCVYGNRFNTIAKVLSNRYLIDDPVRRTKGLQGRFWSKGWCYAHGKFFCEINGIYYFSISMYGIFSRWSGLKAQTYAKWNIHNYKPIPILY